jgi:phospholipase C
MFENRSFDSLLGRLYQPGEVASFEGVIGQDLSNPVPEWARLDTDHKVVRYGVAAHMDVPNPDSGEEFAHVNTQLFGLIDPPGNRCVLAEQMTAPFNAPVDPNAEPAMDGFVADYISSFTAETGRQPGYDEYAQIMIGYAPEQVPVMSAIARGFATFDHWHCDVPSQTFTNRSFYHAGTSSGFVVNAPYDNFPLHNEAETVFERLAAAGLPWRVYVDPGMRMSATGMIHAPRLSRYFASNFSTLADFFEDAERGRLPAYSFIEPCLIHAHNDYHPAVNALGVRIPTLAVSAYIDPKTVVSRGYRNTSLIATLRARWNLGPPLTARDATAPDIAAVLARSTPRAQEDWPEVIARPVPQLSGPLVPLDKPLPPLGRYLLGIAIALDIKYTGHVPDIDPRTATARQADDYLDDRTARIYPGLVQRA